MYEAFLAELPSRQGLILLTGELPQQLLTIIDKSRRITERLAHATVGLEVDALLRIEQPVNHAVDLSVPSRFGDVWIDDQHIGHLGYPFKSRVPNWLG